MSADSQWPRWEVFKQDNARKVHQAVGSVHAADPEHALLTARNIFVRRPSAVSLWVAPAEAIISVTAEQLEADPQPLAAYPEHTLQSYTVFGKRGQRSSMTYVDYLGELEASSAADALQQAMKRFAEAETFVWWLVASADLYQSRDEDIDAWFEPAVGKTYKQQSQYGTVRSSTATTDPAAKGA